MSDVDGRYRGRDQKIHQLQDLKDQQYTVFSLWDTYRANHPLFTIIDQKRTGAFVRTFLRQYEQGGDLPVWELAGCETECMIGYHSVSVISDAYLKGIRDFDAKLALKAMVSTAKADEFGKIAYAKNGLISSADEPESVSRTLEYA
jgi:putative alpha-1,2-mannosidase